MSNYFNNFSKDKLKGESSTKEVPMSISSLIATCFLHGKSVPVPGTVGTLLAIPFAIILAYVPFMLSLLIIAIIFALGTIATNKYMDAKGSHDPSEVIIDEFVAYLLITIFLAPTMWMFILTFALFRFFDAVKPFPIIWVDKKIDGGLGVMVDDIAAAVATLIAYAIITFIF